MRKRKLILLCERIQATFCLRVESTNVHLFRCTCSVAPAPLHLLRRTCTSKAKVSDEGRPLGKVELGTWSILEPLATGVPPITEANQGKQRVEPRSVPARGCKTRCAVTLLLNILRAFNNFETKPPFDDVLMITREIGRLLSVFEPATLYSIKWT